MNCQTKNHKTTYLNLNRQISIESHLFRFYSNQDYIKSSTLNIAGEAYSLSYFGEAINEIKFRKNQIVLILKSESLEEFYTNSDNLCLSNPISNLLGEIRSKLGIFIKGLKIVVEIN